MAASDVHASSSTRSNSALDANVAAEIDRVRFGAPPTSLQVRKKLGAKSLVTQT
jgi:hypothetical protein